MFTTSGVTTCCFSNILLLSSFFVSSLLFSGHIFFLLSFDDRYLVVAATKFRFKTENRQGCGAKYRFFKYDRTLPTGLTN